jgi:chemotaxis protein CheC
MSAPVELRALRDINRLADASAATVRGHIEQMAGVEATVSVTGLTFLAPDDLGQHLGTAQTYAATVPIESRPHGVFCLNFGEEGGAALAEQMTGTAIAGNLSGIQKSALKELTNILASGFLDGMANTLETEIIHGPPTIYHDAGPGIADEITRSGGERSILVIVNTSVALPALTETPVTFYLIPAADEFASLLNELP